MCKVSFCVSVSCVNLQTCKLMVFQLNSQIQKIAFEFVEVSPKIYKNC